MRRKTYFLVEVRKPKVMKLTDEQVEELLRKHSRDGVGYKRLAAEFRVSRRYVQLICQGLRRGGGRGSTTHQT